MEIIGFYVLLNLLALAFPNVFEFITRPLSRSFLFNIFLILLFLPLVVIAGILMLVIDEK